MLTIQSNLKIQDLETLSKILIKPDIINFGLNKVGGGYTYKIADKVIAKLSKLDKNKIIVIINDITLQMTDKLLDAGYKNLYLAFGRFNRDGSVLKDKTVYNIMKAIIKNNIKQRLNVISLEEIFNMKIDGIIANVPYGAIGANIAYIIREKIDYEYFVNLLPANDYKRNKTKDLFNYQSEMEAIQGFDGTTAIITTCSLVHKNKTNNMTLNEFEISSFDKSILDKYFIANMARSTYRTKCDIISGPVNLNIIIPTRTSSGDHSGEHHLPYSKTATSYRLNHGEFKTYDEAKGSSKKLGGCSIIIPTQIEHDNIVEFIYSENGFKFISLLFTIMHKDTLTEITYWFPKVDWTRSWTVEEILRDYGYTEEEIVEVMADLDNFKGMDD